MDPWRIYIAAAFTLLSLAPASQAQHRMTGPRDATFRFERLDGLSHNTVTALLQDSAGFLWIGTSDGLNRYDGYDFTVHRHIPGDPTALSNNTIKALLEDRAGHLWVGTDEGLHRLDRRTGRFIRYHLQTGQPASRPQAIFHLLEDHTGRLWVGSSDGLYRYERGSDRFSGYRHAADNPNSLADNSIWSLYEDQEGILWVGSSGGLHRYARHTDQFVRFPVPPSWVHVTIHYRSEAGLWISGGEGDGVVMLDLESNRFMAWTEMPAGEAWWSLEDSNGVRWRGSADGLYRYDPATGVQQHLRVDPSPGAYLQNRIKTLYEDRVGTLWIGTLSGLYRLDAHVKPFEHLAHDPTVTSSLSGNTVMAILEDAAGGVWVGTLGAGLNRLDRRAGTFTRYRAEPDRPHTLCNDLIWALYEDRRGGLWIGTDEGLCAFSPRTGQFTRYRLPGPSDMTRQPPVHTILEDRKGALWIGTTAGLYRLDPQTGSARWYEQPGHEQTTSSTFFVQSLHLDQTDALWIGTLGGGLYRFDPATQYFNRHRLLRDGKDELVSEGIWAIHEQTDGALWLGSDLGLTRFEPQTGAARHFTRADGLPGSIVYALLEDDAKRLWMSTNLGLARLDDRAEGGGIRVYDAGDGLKNTEFNRRAAFKGQDGTFYFGGLNGLTWFQPAAIQDNPHAPPVAITRIETSNRDTTVAVNPFGLEELVLSYRDYTVSFAFTALNFTNPGQNRYAYQLAGFDEQWIEAGPRRFASYTNIPPGDYTFLVRGSNDDGVWNEQGAALALTVTPPFWQTWWFRVLLVTTVAGLLAMAHHYRVSQLLEVERLRIRIAQDLHDDIGSGLSSIALASELAGHDPRLSAEKRHQFAVVTQKARQLTNALTDIVWLVDPEQDRLGDLIEYMEETTPALLVGLDYRFARPTPTPPQAIDPASRRSIYLLYKEILHNIVKHAQATQVAVALEVKGSTLVLTVADNGVGFEAATLHKGHGLKNMQHRATQMNGSLAFDSRPGEGTTVRFTAQLP